MVRKVRRRKGLRRRRIFRRRRGTATKALAIARGISRKLAAEVKKADNNLLIGSTGFIQLSAGNTSSLADFGLLYNVFGNSGMVQGIQLDDFIGEQIRTKYLYLGIHLQSITNYVGGATDAPNLPVSIRCLVVQDRNYNVASPSAEGADFQDVRGMVQNLFGISTNTLSISPGYQAGADYSLLPINPMEPGRFNVIRDFRMTIAPGWRNDYYKKLYLRQSDFNSKGRIYFGPTWSSDGATTRPPGDATDYRQVARNNIYVLFLFQVPVNLVSNAQTGEVIPPNFNLSVQTRLAYYDN